MTDLRVRKLGPSLRLEKLILILTSLHLDLRLTSKTRLCCDVMYLAASLCLQAYRESTVCLMVECLWKATY